MDLSLSFAVLSFDVFDTTLKLALLPRDLHLRATVAQAHFTTLDTGHESYLFPALLVDITHSPDSCHEGVTRFDRTRESCSKLFDVGWIRVSKKLQQPVSCSVPTEQAMKNGTACKILAYVALYHWHLCSAYRSPFAGQALE
jgi:hypothetical protein